MIDSLALAPGGRVVHIGAGTGYYSAIIGYVVGETGRVVAAEIDEPLAAAARGNLASMPWVEVQQNDGSSVHGPLDAILVNAGVTHPQESWLDALAPGGRLLLPLTVAMPAMGGTLGKGVMLMIRKSEAGALAADVTSFVAIYSALGLRDGVLESTLAQALRRTSFPSVTRTIAWTTAGCTRSDSVCRWNRSNRLSAAVHNAPCQPRETCNAPPLTADTSSTSCTVPATRCCSYTARGSRTPSSR